MHGANLTKDISLNHLFQRKDKDSVNLPFFSGILETTMNKGKSLVVDGTNVVRVPFGVREPRRKRPHNPQRLATLILPFQNNNSPTPPPHAA